MKVDKKNGNVNYNDDAHVYWDNESKYISVTTLIEKYTKPFEKDFWSLYKAIERLLSADEFKMEKKQLLDTHKVNFENFESYGLDKLTILSKQQDILDEWETTNKISTDRGTSIHAELENSFYKSKKCDLKRFGLEGNFDCKKDYVNLDLENGIYPEYLVYRKSADGVLRIAGQIDLLVKQGNDIYIFDWKTNKELKTKSFFNSATRKNQTMNYPLNNLMDCNMMHYSLQLSTYAWMIQQMNPDFIIKKLTIIHYDHSGGVTNHNIEYLKDDVERMLMFYKKELEYEEFKKSREKIVF